MQYVRFLRRLFSGRSDSVYVTPVTLAVSFFLYLPLMGMFITVGVLLILFVHELGHVWAMRRMQLPAGKITFIPFIGAVVRAPLVSKDEHLVPLAYGGPLIGGLSALALFGIWTFMPEHSRFAEAVLFSSHLGVLLNLSNLLPISPLDGGRITRAIFLNVEEGSLSGRERNKWFVLYVSLVTVLVIVVMLQIPLLQDGSWVAILQEWIT